MIGWVRSPREAEMPYLLPELRGLPELGRLTGRGDTLNLERLIAAKPDLIVDFGTVRDTYRSLADRVQAQVGIPRGLCRTGEGRLRDRPGGLAGLGIADLADRDAIRISGGQRQLALVARALAQRAEAVFMDEPTASLDLANRLMVLERITALAKDGLSVLVSTHEPEQAFAIADRVAVIGYDNHFVTGPVRDILTAEQLSRLYGVPLIVENTPSGRLVVGPAP
jgi:hypothetical protein